MKTLVSIIITTKNEARNIERLLESIKNQSYKNIEVLVVDNNSSDNTKDRAKKFTSKVYNIGPERSSQRNYGSKKSSGKYLLFLDADMELSAEIVSKCLQKVKDTDIKMVTIAETTVGNGIIAKARKFEREMYMGEPLYEVSRFFERQAFFEFNGYDPNLTGPEDYDLPLRMQEKYKAGRINEYIYHHEETATLLSLLKKKYYYAGRGAIYASKHPKLIWTQGAILFRSVYFKNWRKFVMHPFIGLSFLAVRTLETVWAVAGFLRVAGFKKMAEVILRSFK